MARSKKNYSNKKNGSSGKPNQGGNYNGKQNNNKREEQSTSGRQSDQESRADSAESGNSDSQSESKPRSTTNDPEWYAFSPEMLLTTANIPFSDPLGSRMKFLDIGTHNECTVAAATKYISAGGLASIKLKHTVGHAEALTDAVNTAAVGLYTHIRVVNSGRKNYDPADLMMYCLAIGDLYSCIQWLKRIYALAFQYSQRNWFIGRHMLEDQGINYSNIVTNLANFATYINTIQGRISSFALPSTINFFKRRMFTYSSYYLENDEGNIKDQLYQFIPSGFYKFALTNGIGSLVWTPWNYDSSNLATLQNLISYVNGLVNAVYGDEDFALMSGDIIKAYGDSLLSLDVMASDYAVAPTYDPDVLWQIRNADIIHTNLNAQYTDADGNSRSYGNVYQSSKGIITCRENWDTFSTFQQDMGAFHFDAERRRLLDSDKPLPTPLDVIESTRLQVAPLNYVTSEKFWEISTGVDYVVGISISLFSAQADGNDVQTERLLKTSRVVLVDSSGHLSINAALIGGYSEFKYLPALFEVQFISNSTAILGVYVLGDVDNYTLYDNDALKNMHEVACMSLFWVPGIAQMINFKA